MSSIGIRVRDWASALVSLATVSAAAHADTIATFDARLQIPALPSGAFLGWRADAMASDGNRVALGAYGVQRAFVFERASDGAWSMVAELSPPEDAAWFGIGVAMQGDEIVVGAPNAASAGFAESGRAFVFRRQADGQWTLSQTIEPVSPSSQLWFGSSVALDGDLLAVGTGGLSGPAQAVYLYSRGPTDTWALESMVSSPDANIPDSARQFGTPVRLAAGRLITADCSWDAPGQADAGRGYVFRRTDSGAWALEARLDHPSPASGDGYLTVGGGRFIATSVALAGSTAVLALGGDDTTTGADQGSAHVFERDQSGDWSLRASLVASDGRAGDWMGWSAVRIVGDEILVGSAGWDGVVGNLPEIGRVVRFGRDAGGWMERSSIVDPMGLAGDRFGGGVAAGGGFVCITSRNGDGGRGCGSVFGFGDDCDENFIADPLDIVRGSEDSNENGVLDECECSGDLTGDMSVDGDDLGSLLGTWGPCSMRCVADLNRDGFVNGADLGQLLNSWGPCPV